MITSSKIKYFEDLSSDKRIFFRLSLTIDIYFPYLSQFFKKNH